MIELKDLLDELKQDKRFADGFDREYGILKTDYLCEQAGQQPGLESANDLEAAAKVNPVSESTTSGAFVLPGKTETRMMSKL